MVRCRQGERLCVLTSSSSRNVWFGQPLMGAFGNLGGQVAAMTKRFKQGEGVAAVCTSKYVWYGSTTTLAWAPSPRKEVQSDHARKNKSDFIE